MHNAPPRFIFIKHVLLLLSICLIIVGLLAYAILFAQKSGSWIEPRANNSTHSASTPHVASPPATFAPFPTTTTRNQPSPTSSTVPGNQPSPTSPTAPTGMKLTWSDTFRGTGLDTTKWNIQDSSTNGYHVCCLYYGLQYYTPQDVQVQNGVLRLTSQQRDMGGYHYTSGAVTTENKYAFLYGQIDIRVQLPRSQGIWPALWLLPQGNTQYEIDLMELLGNDPHTVYMTNHWSNGGEKDYCQYTGPDFSQDFHTFSLSWSSSSLTWLIDGVPRCHLMRGVPNEKMYLIINSAVGGEWPGNPDASTSFPQYNDIEYVKVYQ